jgi:hypothetical protein
LEAFVSETAGFCVVVKGFAWVFRLF